jgi:hypothetical protein
MFLEWNNRLVNPEKLVLFLTNKLYNKQFLLKKCEPIRTFLLGKSLPGYVSRVME